VALAPLRLIACVGVNANGQMGRETKGTMNSV